VACMYRVQPTSGLSLSFLALSSLSHPWSSSIFRIVKKSARYSDVTLPKASQKRKSGPVTSRSNLDLSLYSHCTPGDDSDEPDDASRGTSAGWVQILPCPQAVHRLGCPSLHCTNANCPCFEPPQAQAQSAYLSNLLAVLVAIVASSHPRSISAVSAIRFLSTLARVSYSFADDILELFVLLRCTFEHTDVVKYISQTEARNT
jgi:hypothetical protein